jgi:hypothetical protein
VATAYALVTGVIILLYGTKTIGGLLTTLMTMRSLSMNQVIHDTLKGWTNLATQGGQLL